jgi:hypothetical protein
VRYGSGVVITYVKAGYRLIGIAAVALPILREAQKARRDPVRIDPSETMEALSFWVDRRRRLPFYRVAARREADQMIRIWQGRAVRDLPQSRLAKLGDGTAVGLGGQLVRYHAGRWLARSARLFVAWTAVLGLLVYVAVR